MRTLRIALLLTFVLFVSAGYAQNQQDESAQIQKELREINQKTRENEQRQQEVEAQLKDAERRRQVAKAKEEVTRAKEEVERLQEKLREAQEETRKTKEELTQLEQRLKEIESRIHLRITPLSLHFGSQGGKETIQVTTNSKNWYVSSFPEWCTSLKDSDYFTVDCKVNNDDERAGFLTVRADDIEMTVHITQEANSTTLSQGKWRNDIYKVMSKGITQSNDGTYKGEIVNNQRMGLGLLLWYTGSIYIGNWGNWTNQNRTTFGKQGAGIYISPDGYTINNCPECCYLSGNWEKDNRSGYGACYDVFGNCIYQGDFLFDRPTDTYPSTKNLSMYKFECIEYENGNQYLGETKNGKQHGYGLLLYKTGDVWYGKWENGNRSGQGIYLRLDGGVSLGN